MTINKVPMSLSRKLSGRSPVQVRRDLRLEAQAAHVACRLKLSLLRAEYAHLPEERGWPPIADLPASVARGYALDNEVAQLMALVATDRTRTIRDELWRARAAELYALPVAVRRRTTA
ncbi:gll1886 [Gloeobacter violaceus PCC 7421]|uniref:Gll1886 protein n=2 Tax=Gloeobacter violaceus TaxID=33072 RepID=Q7NJE6_GLOVI|nr:gll1886 [Gloeobacter violaceus PCC 7421]